MNFIQLEYFRRVVESGSVTQASKALFITQPAVSKQIRLLEEEEALCELARLLGSDALSEAALSNAREMRRQAKQHKKD